MRHRVTSAPWGLIVPVLVLVAGAQLEIVSRPLEGSRPLLVAIALVYSLALLAATRVPLVAVAIAFGALGLMALVARSATNEAAAPMFAGLAGAFLVARYGTGRQPLAGLAIALVTVVLVARDQPSFAGAFATFAITAVLVAVTWGTGVALRGREQHAAAAESRAEHAEAEREATARLAVAEERARIARELHDIVAHSVSVMVLKAGAVRHRLPDTLAADKDALRDVEAAGREALTEMRQLLGAMRPDDDHAERAPQPSIDGVRRLVDEVSRAGLAANLGIDGRPRPLSRGIELSAYRIVQEGLTNALRHARAQRVDVHLHYGDDALSIEVRDDGRTSVADGDPGHGLIGVRERVKVYGGEMSAGRGADGGFVLRSSLPIGAGER